MNYLREEVNSRMVQRILKHHSRLIALYKSRGYLKDRVNTYYSILQHAMSGADVLHAACRA